MHKQQNTLILDHISGPIRFNMTNDFIVLQRSNRVLIRLLCAMLHLEKSDIQSAIITNPIHLGDTIDSKTVILDVKVLMNDNTNVNLEMQVANHHNWTDRSIYYLYRSFSNLEKNENYRSVRPSYQIGFLDYTLFPDEPEFYATYLLMNRRTHRFILTNSVSLGYVQLKQIWQQ